MPNKYILLGMEDLAPLANHRRRTDPDDSSMIIVELEGYKPKDITQKLLIGLNSLLDTPQVITEIHEMLHPVVQTIQYLDNMGQLHHLPRHQTTQKMVRKLPQFWQKWQKELEPKNDESSIEIDLDFYNDQIVETLNNDVQLHAQNMHG